MLVDTQPATHQHVPASPEVRDEWIDSQLIGVLMDNASMALLAAVLVIPGLIFILWDQVATPLLLGWLGMALVVLYGRFKLVEVYRLRYDSVEGMQRQAFMRRYVWTWGAVGALWALPVAMTYLQTTLQTQFVVGLALMGYGLLSLTAFSAWAGAFHAYINSLVGTVMISLLGVQWWLGGSRQDYRMTMVLMFLLLVFWFLLRMAGQRLNQIHRSSFELQFSNQELIDSLTRQTQASLRAVATKNRFLASAAHDLRQPVHALSLYADWLATEPEMAREISPRILQSTRAINELFDSLFDLTRIDAGNYKVRLQNVDVTQLFADLALQYEPIAAGKSLKLRTHARPAVIWADPVVLRRILGNLLSNAIKHTQRGGILLALRQRPDMLVLGVWDTGVGIAREHQQAIFQEFFRVSQHQGTEDSLGLGLTIVSKLATLMGYQLALRSEPGRGSVFRVMLPAYTQNSVSEPLTPHVLLSSQLMELR
ncbi:MAG: HAMP domain-containing sensor histidine kinase [Pseudomonadota bacterium]